MSDGRRVTVQPVFIEPTFQHSFLTSTRYAFIVLFEAAVALVLIAWFFGAEARQALRRAPPPEPAPLEALAAGTRLACHGDALVILGLPGGPTPALNRDGSEVRLRACAELLRSVNGP
uniref:Uncharacterized protein n=1 Tax=Rousettus bat poxvirus TaxID=3141933 RepID=A0AAU7E272_9POXV